YRGDPVEAVATEVHEPPTLSEIQVQSVEHLPRPVLGMRAGKHYVVRGEQVRPFGVKVFVCDDVVLESLRFEPVDEAEVFGEVPDPAFPAHDTRSHVVRPYD